MNHKSHWSKMHGWQFVNPFEYHKECSPGLDFNFDGFRSKYSIHIIYSWCDTYMFHLHIISKKIVLSLSHAIVIHPGYGSIASKHQYLSVTTTETKSKVLCCPEEKCNNCSNNITTSKHSYRGNWVINYNDMTFKNSHCHDWDSTFISY